VGHTAWRPVCDAGSSDVFALAAAARAGRGRSRCGRHDAGAATPPKAERPALVLVGTIVGETRKFAVFTDETTQKIIHLEIGEEHGGWILRLVTSAEARLETAHQAVTLALRPPGGESAKGSEAVAATALVPPVRHRKR